MGNSAYQNHETKTPQLSFSKNIKTATHRRTATGAAPNIKKDKMIGKDSSNQKNNKAIYDNNLAGPYRALRTPKSIRASVVSKSDSLKSSS